MAQKYTSPVARDRMAKGKCPECGATVGMHDGLGGPFLCTLTDTGVAQRIAEFNKGKETQNG